MPSVVIDLRSDTVTRPSAEMRRAMAAAEVGDDVFGEDPTVNRLQARAAEIFGRPAALYVPSGTMGNLASILAQTQHGQEVICESQGHVYNYEMASMAAIAGVLPRVVAGRDGILTWADIEPAIRPKAGADQDGSGSTRRVDSLVRYNSTLMDLLVVAQILIALAVGSSILLQARGTGLSSTFGGESTAYRSRRGLERVLFRLTVVLAIVFVIISLVGARPGG